MPKATTAKTDNAVVKKDGPGPTTSPSKATQASSPKAASSTASSAAKVTAAQTSASESTKPAGIVETKATSASSVVKDATALSKAPESKVKDAAKETAAKLTPASPAPKQEKPTPQQKPEERSSVFWPLVFGGVIAGGLGFLVSELDILNTRPDTVKFEHTLSMHQERIATLENAEVPAAGLPEFEELQTGISALSDMVSTLEERLTELENRPVPSGDGSGPSPEYAEGLAALQSSVEEQKNEIERLLENALSVEEATENAARQAAVQGALTKITAALNSGEGFSEAVAQLTENGIDDVPAALADNAADGVVTLLSLQTGFAGAARAALSSARAAGTGESEGGVSAFLKRQLGARSVAPREGSDPDAVLSRAEAAVRQGRVTDALAEIDALPVPAQDAMADWLASARPRAAVEAAVQDLSQRLSAN